VRGDLTEARGFSNVSTDYRNRTCSFVFSKSEGELELQLNELAKTNTHLRDWREKD
jgi:hypothetical protein